MKKARKGSRKREAQDRRDAWRKAVSEGRVVMIGDGSTGRTYLTVGEAEAAVVTMNAQGLRAWIPKEG